MKVFYISVLCIATLFSANSYGQSSNAADNAVINRWKKAIVEIESTQQRYNFDQVDVILHKQTDSIKGLSQHDKYNTQGELLTLKDTIRGTGLLLSDGDKIYLVTAKHIIKATENAADHSERVNDLITIKTNVGNQLSNDISLMNLSDTRIGLQPFIFSSNQTDLGIISFQKGSYKAILAYLRQKGCVPVPVQWIEKNNAYTIADEVLAIGFPGLPGKGHDKPSIEKGKIVSSHSALPYFTVNLNVYPGNSGGPVIKNNKLIGILSFQSGISTNIAAALHPYDKASSATVIKASNIIPLLKKLQQHEANSLFK